eukprot:scaffold3892_cov255-Pinguiococcus_pyrenoidosus.AAC.1
MHRCVGGSEAGTLGPVDRASTTPRRRCRRLCSGRTEGVLWLRGVLPVCRVGADDRRSSRLKRFKTRKGWGLGARFCRRPIAQEAAATSRPLRRFAIGACKVLPRVPANSASTRRALQDSPSALANGIEAGERAGPWHVDITFRRITAVGELKNASEGAGWKLHAWQIRRDDWRPRASGAPDWRRTFNVTKPQLHACHGRAEIQS